MSEGDVAVDVPEVYACEFAVYGRPERHDPWDLQLQSDRITREGTDARDPVPASEGTVQIHELVREFGSVVLFGPDDALSTPHVASVVARHGKFRGAGCFGDVVLFEWAHDVEDARQRGGIELGERIGHERERDDPVERRDVHRKPAPIAAGE